MTKRTDTRPLDARSFTYSAVGATEPASETWPATTADLQRYERTVTIGTSWDEARSVLLRWAVKTRSGFTVDADSNGDDDVSEGSNAWLTLTLGPFQVREPIRVVAVVDAHLRVGFSYGTLEGHPVSGEEAFVLHRATEHGPVMLTIRSLTRPAQGGVWRYLFPVLLIAQRLFRRRYLRSL